MSWIILVISSSILWQDTFLLCKILKVLSHEDELYVMNVPEENVFVRFLKISYEGIELFCFCILTHEHISHVFYLFNAIKGLYCSFPSFFVVLIQLSTYGSDLLPVIIICHGLSENFYGGFWIPSALFDIDPQLWDLNHLFTWKDLDFKIVQFVLFPCFYHM